MKATKIEGAERTTIVLTAPHTHAGRDYPAGTRLALADMGLDAESAQWLVTIGKARWAPAEPAPDASTKA